MSFLFAIIIAKPPSDSRRTEQSQLDHLPTKHLIIDALCVNIPTLSKH
ncbi:hypothetical protein SAMN02745161_1694 [Halodesulfovibrio marinisediminis DSM 17456]|uniref:Uncharacterized protein n=1 Tax=Halodesulfovibrio marinisediminis DSM 17456 TaxID=1121457 RepID=A0A1N6GMW2_9BACT|nr:hypothetical protein SAMN02745161_1694 [Halodesulfovibrio marinisediminis DSM 17456]